MPKHGSILLYVHGNQKAREDGQPRTATSTLTQLLNYDNKQADSICSLTEPEEPSSDPSIPSDPDPPSPRPPPSGPAGTLRPSAGVLVLYLTVVISPQPLDSSGEWWVIFLTIAPLVDRAATEIKFPPSDIG